jgi:hypothetical protein
MVDRSTLIDVSPSPVECVGVLLQHRPIAAPGNYSNLTVGAFTSPLFQKNCHFHSNCGDFRRVETSGRERFMSRPVCVKFLT